MKIKDLAHAFRVLEFIVGLEKDLDNRLNQDKPMAFLTLLDGAKAMLDKNWPDLPEKGHPERRYWEGIIHERKNMFMDLAQAYAPRMTEAGMEVPE